MVSSSYIFVLVLIYFGEYYPDSSRQILKRYFRLVYLQKPSKKKNILSSAILDKLLIVIVYLHARDMLLYVLPQCETQG